MISVDEATPGGSWETETSEDVDELDEDVEFTNEFINRGVKLALIRGVKAMSESKLLGSRS